MTDKSIIKDIAPDPNAAIIWMHGLGADGNDFVPIVNEMDLSGLRIRFVFPHAPARAVSINMGMWMPAWYDLRQMEFTRDEDRGGIEHSQQRIEALIAALRLQDIDASRIILAGFSQGGAMALHCGLRYPESLAGIIALSCYLPLAESIATEATAANRNTPIFMAQGSADPVVPLSLANQSKQLLRELGYNVQWQEYPTEHSVCLEEIQAISKWIKQTLA